MEMPQNASARTDSQLSRRSSERFERGNSKNGEVSSYTWNLSKTGLEEDQQSPLRRDGTPLLEPQVNDGDTQKASKSLRREETPPQGLKALNIHNENHWELNFLGCSTKGPVLHFKGDKKEKGPKPSSEPR